MRIEYDRYRDPNGDWYASRITPQVDHIPDDALPSEAWRSYVVYPSTDRGIEAWKGRLLGQRHPRLTTVQGHDDSHHHEDLPEYSHAAERASF